MKKLPFSILMQDYENSGKNFIDYLNCPLFQAFKRQFPHLSLMSASVHYCRIKIGQYKTLALSLGNIFGEKEFKALAEGKEFYTFINIPEEYLAPEEDLASLADAEEEMKYLG